MSNTICLNGPAFSLSGESYFPNHSVNFHLEFDNSDQTNNILKFEWYLNGFLISDQNNQTFAALLNCGKYDIAVRILSMSGWSGLKSLQFETCKVPLSSTIVGPGILKEGQSAGYLVLLNFSDGSVQNITGSYAFSVNYGSFNGNIFTAPANNTTHDSRLATITAVKANETPLIRDITVIDATPVSLVTLAIIGPDEIYEDVSAFYQVKATYSDNTSQVFTDDYRFSSPDGTFLGNSFLPFELGAEVQSRPSIIYAEQNGIRQLNKPITIKENSGILVVDIYDTEGLNLIGMIASPEVYGGTLDAYTGKNIVPSTLPANALLLASDHITDGRLRWRFELNLEKLRKDYPNSEDFVFEIRGRGASASAITGIYSLKSNDAIMSMAGTTGAYIPTVTSGHIVGSLQNWSSQVFAGANGSHDEDDLPLIIQFVYHVADNSISTLTRDPQVIPDFDYMAVDYNWRKGAGRDLDILVGFENNETTADGQYVGYGNGETLPRGANPKENSYLWWGTDDTSVEGKEGVLIGMEKFVHDFPDSHEIIEIGLYSVWFGQPITGVFTVGLTTYKGGTMGIVGTSFVNTGGEKKYSNIAQLKTLINSQSFSPGTSFKLGTVKYNKTTKTATVQFNLPVAPIPL